MSFSTKVKTGFLLGLTSLGRVIFYRLSLRFGLNPVTRISASIPSGDFFHMPVQIEHVELEVNSQWLGQHYYFGWYQINTPRVPDWHSNPFNGESVDDPSRTWWSIPDFDPRLGDIKAIWEASRFDWVVGLAQRACQGDEACLNQINVWLANWIEKNPPYLGPNWKCGQEASIRVMHLAISTLILKQIQDVEPALLDLIKIHLKRIAPTINYAIGQDNNHGTSEAAALFIGGSWLELAGEKEGKKWRDLGRKWLENRALKLIEVDGSFSQYSVNYHRLMLDTFSMVEVWRRALNLTGFSKPLYSRLAQATNWLYQFTQLENGDTPNLGANDGSRLLPLTIADYRDFRPSLQLAMTLFRECSAIKGEGIWNSPLYWLGLSIPDKQAKPQLSQQFEQGGYVLSRRGSAFFMFSYPNYHFRPAQADALHVDLWLAGENLLRDAGTFSYASDSEAMEYFGGTKSHNTVQFDDRDQMPRLSRFLFGNWLNAARVEALKVNSEEDHCGAGYSDQWGASHYRSIDLSEHRLKVTDTVSGFQEKAVLRWRLKPGNWELKGNTLSDERCSLVISADIPVDDIALSKGWESRYYLSREVTPVLEVVVSKPACLVTELFF